jgi:hypothetical protein
MIFTPKIKRHENTLHEINQKQKQTEKCFEEEQHTMCRVDINKFGKVKQKKDFRVKMKKKPEENI